MKKFLTVLLCIIMMATMTISAMAVKTNTANKVETIVIDGIKDDAYGDGAFTVDAVRDDTDPDGATGKVWAAWDDNYLYYYAEIYDTTPHFPGSGIAQNNSDSMTFFTDWNAGGVIFGNPEGTPFDDGTTPWWEIRVYSGADEVTGEWPVHGGWSLGNDATDGSAFDVTIDWTEQDGIIDHVVVPLNGSYNNGYIVEIKIKAPANVKLEQGKVIPVELHVTDNMKGEDARDGRKYLEYHDNFANAWASPGNAGGRLTLGEAYVPPVDPAASDDTMGGGETADAETAPVIAAVTTTPSVRTGDTGTIIFVIAMITAAAGIAIFKRKSAVK